MILSGGVSIRTSIGFVVRYDAELDVVHCATEAERATCFTNARSAYKFLRGLAVRNLGALDHERLELVYAIVSSN